MSVTLLSVLNQSTRVSDADVERMVAACARQLAQDVSPRHGIVPAIEWVPTGSSPSVAKPAGAPVYILDTPDIDGALGYHDEGPDGVPYVKVFAAPTLDNGGTVLSGPNSVSVTLSHELIELVGDPNANLWADSGDGSDYAVELCDAVEGDSYDVNGVAVSNFLLRDFFDARAPAGTRFDFLGKLTEPFTMTAGGYQIHRTEPGQVTQVTAKAEGRAVQAISGRILLTYGEKFPTWKLPGKIEKARRRRSPWRGSLKRAS